MRIVGANQEHREEGFSAAVELEEIDIENLLKVFKFGDEKECNAEASKIIEFAINEGKWLPITDDEDDKIILIEIRRKQWVLFEDAHNIKNGLKCILA